MSPLTGRKTSRLLVMCNDVAFNQSLKVQTKTKTIYENVTKIVDQRIAVSELLILEVLLFVFGQKVQTCDSFVCSSQVPFECCL